MAITLTSTKSSTLEPLRKNRWIFQFASVPGGGDAAELAFAAYTATIPKTTFNVTESHRLNERFYIAGKPQWNECACTFYDYINGAKSAGHQLYMWSQSIYNPITGQMFFKTQYTTSATMAQLDPAGAIVRLWNMFYVWPFDVAYGDQMSYEDDAIAEASCSFRYDYALKGTDVDTSPQ